MSDVKILHITAEDLLLDSFLLGKKVYETGFRPKFAISIWRGGTPVGLGVDAFYRMRGQFMKHTTVATTSYTGIGNKTEVIVKNLEHVVKTICREDSLLIIDDVYESGKTIEKIIETIKKRARSNFPEHIVIATIHNKPEKNVYTELPVISLKNIEHDVWIDYPHELGDLVTTEDKEDILIQNKSKKIWDIIQKAPFPIEKIETENDYLYMTAEDLLIDSFKLGANIWHDSSFFPDYIIALWPGGVCTGLPVHEIFKYYIAKGKGVDRKSPDHITINTRKSYSSFTSNIIGLTYLEERVTKDDNLLIIDTTFRGGQLCSHVVNRLRESLRRNLNLKRVRLAAVYYNPQDKSTWINKPTFEKPHYYLKEVNKEVIYPQSIQKLKNPQKELKNINKKLWEILFN